MPFPCTAVLDNFNRANANTLGANWSPFGQAGNDAGIINNTAYDANGTWNYLYWNPATYGDGCEVYATMSALMTTDGTGLIWFLRMKDMVPGAGNYDGYGYMFWRTNAANIWVQIRRYDNGVATGLGATVAVVPAGGDVYAFRAIGGYLFGYRNWALQLTRTDATYPDAGYLGFYFPNEANWRMDDFGGGTMIGHLRRRQEKY